MATWLEDITNGLEELNGIAPLSEIYKRLREKRPFPHPDSFDAIIRREIQTHSSDSDSYGGDKDLFYSVAGLGGGVWGLRNMLTKTPVAVDAEISGGEVSPGRVHQDTYRVLRDTNLARQLKQLHQNKCQLCGVQIPHKEGKFYSEAHHIIPLGKPHNGPDTPENIIVLCPNHHAMLDYGAVILIADQINHNSAHLIGEQYIAYHNQYIFNSAGG